MAARRKAKPRPLPTFDPVPSAQFGLEILDRSNSHRALIGRVAMWYWLDDEADHEYTKNVAFAVAKVKDLDIEATRDLVRTFLGPGLLGRLEECLRRAGHPRARRAYSLGS